MRRSPPTAEFLVGGGSLRRTCAGDRTESKSSLQYLLVGRFELLLARLARQLASGVQQAKTVAVVVDAVSLAGGERDFVLVHLV